MALVFGGNHPSDRFRVEAKGVRIDIGENRDASIDQRRHGVADMV